VSVTVALIWFLVGSGLITLGAFFLWYWVGGRCDWQVTLAIVLPVATVALMATLGGCSEMAMGMLCGAVAFNCALMGLLSLIFRVRTTRVNILMMALWVAFGLGAGLSVGHNGNMGMFTGWGLVTVGLVAIWQMCACKETESVRQNGHKWFSHHSVCWLFLAVVLLGVGAWLVIKQHAVVSAVLMLPDGLLGTIVVAPLCGGTVLWGLRAKQQWQPQRLLMGLTRGNALVATVGIGLVTVLRGGIHLTQSMSTITLPWVAGLVIVGTVAVFLPQKTARWWGGLSVAMYLGYVISLLV